jgi:O-methyltransferase
MQTNDDKKSLEIGNPQARLYIDLLKDCLTFAIWGDCDYPLGLHRKNWKYRLTGFWLLADLLDRFDLRLERKACYNPQARAEGSDWPVIAHTMIGLNRMQNILACAESVLKNGVPGDFIETGVWRGGACIFMRGILKAYNITDRNVWAADSFQGLPEGNPEKYPLDKGSKFHQVDYLKVSLEEVKKILNDIIYWTIR